MLNFLIAVISDIYEKMQQNHQDVKYRNKCDVNHECAVLDQALNQMWSTCLQSCSNRRDKYDPDHFNFLVIFKATGQESEGKNVNEDGIINEETLKNNYATLLNKFMEDQANQTTKSISEWMRVEFSKNVDYMQ